MLYTGIDKIDTEFGGFEVGCCYLVKGRYGTGKTIIALQFIRFGLEQGEGGVMITAKRGELFLKYAASVGFPLDEFVSKGQLILLEYPVDVDAFLNPVLGFEASNALRELQDYLQLCHATRLVIDPVTPLLTFGVNRNPHGFARIFMSGLANLGCTTLLTSEVDLIHDFQFLLIALEGHVYGTIETDLVPDSGSGIQRIMRVERIRGGPISALTSIFRLEPGRIVFDEPQIDSAVTPAPGAGKTPPAGTASPFFVQQLTRELARARRYNRPLSIVHLNFKALVDWVSMGSKTKGETLLLRILQALEQTCRGSKSFFRHGREKFWVLATETSKENAYSCVRQLEATFLQALAQDGIYEEGGDISLFQYGIASYPENEGDALDLIATALNHSQGRDKAV